MTRREGGVRPLAVITPQVGTLSETFVRRHACGLLPGGTVVLADTRQPPFAGHWDVDGPALYFDRPPAEPVPSAGRRALLAFRRRLFPRPEEPARKRLARGFLLRHGVSAILSEYLDRSLEWLPLARELGIRFYAHAHGYDVSARLREPKWREAYRALDGADGIVAVSGHSRARLAELGLDASRVHVVPCGVDVPPAPPAHPADGETVRCLAVGRIVAKKGPVLLLDAFRRARERDGRLRLDVVGDGPLLPAARQYADCSGISGAVTFHGGQGAAEVAGFLARADLFLQHSVTDPDSGDEEGLPVGILEAMAAALPVVSTRHAGIPEAVAEGETGSLVDEGDTDAMSRSILALSADPAMRRAMGEAGWRRAGERFSWEREREALSALLALR